MKKYLTFVLAIATTIILTGCVKSLDKYGFADKTFIKGRVIEESAHTPISGVNVSITNGTRTYASYTTSSNGLFELEVAFNDIDESYYLLFNGLGKSKTFELKGMGLNMYDYKDMAFYKMGPPVVITSTSSLSGSTVITGGNVTDDGGSPITARGVCYGNLPYPEISGNHTTNGTGTGSYSSNFSIIQGHGTYYIRAYATNALGTSYGEQKTVIHPFDALPSFQYGGHTYKVAPSPGNSMTWEAANSYCNNLSLYGVSGWEMPTRDELVQMYAERYSIGGFNTNYNYRYWSSTTSSNGHYAVDFDDGYINSCYNSNTYQVRPIKSIN